MSTHLLITAEHGGNSVPDEYRHLFVTAHEILTTHRGWDPGSLELAECFARRPQAKLIFATTTRLLVDLNRSPDHPNVFSEFTRPLDEIAQQTLLLSYHLPHRLRVETYVRRLVEQGKRVLHVGMHSFTPELNGVVRDADIGLLYDPSRAVERDLCQHWKKVLKRQRPDLRVRLNYPYKGKSDGLTTTLRSVFPPESYQGVELEVNQIWPLSRQSEWPELQSALLNSFTTLDTSVPDHPAATSRLGMRSNERLCN
ncbi:MAG: N-formylglutamate amidohydrolase [Planctomycetota bacterium]|nr:N-formylglutamate amidohydrolase [Planctomycetota bacterium]